MHDPTLQNGAAVCGPEPGAALCTAEPAAPCSGDTSTEAGAGGGLGSLVGSHGPTLPGKDDWNLSPGLVGARLMAWCLQAGAPPEEQFSPELRLLVEPMKRSWKEEPAEALAARATWPELRTRAPAGGIGAVARLVRAPEAVVRIAVDMGTLRFAEIEGHPAFILRSDCGRFAEAVRMDGVPWISPTGFSMARPLPGSSPFVPVGLWTVGQGIADRPLWSSVCVPRHFAVTAPGPAFLTLLGLLTEAGVDEGGIIAFPEVGFQLCRELVLLLSGKWVRFFLPDEAPWEAAVAGWAEVLEAAGCAVDAFDFGAVGVQDVFGLAGLPESERDFELIS